MTGSLQIKQNKYYAVLSWYEGERRKQKWIATGFDVKGNKRRAEAFLKQELDKLEELQDHHLTGTDQPFLSFMEQWLNEVEGYSIRITTLEQYKAVFRNVISTFPGTSRSGAWPPDTSRRNSADTQRGLHALPADDPEKRSALHFPLSLLGQAGYGGFH